MTAERIQYPQCGYKYGFGFENGGIEHEKIN